MMPGQEGYDPHLFNSTGEIAQEAGYARFSQSGWGHKGEIEVITPDEAAHLIGAARSSGTKLADPVDWNGGNVKGVLITKDDLANLTYFSEKKKDSGLFGVPFLKEALDIAGEVGGGMFGMPIPAGTMISGASNLVSNPSVGGAIKFATDIAAGAGGVMGEVTGMGGISKFTGTMGGNPDLITAATNIAGVASPTSGGSMGFVDDVINAGKAVIAPAVDVWNEGYGIGEAASHALTDALGWNTPSSLPPINFRAQGAEAEYAPNPAGPGTVEAVQVSGDNPAAQPAGTGGTMSMTLSDAVALTGSGRLPRSIPLSALMGSNGMVQVPRGYHPKYLPGRKAQAARAPGEYAVRNKSINYLNLRALRRASHRLQGATRIVRHLFTLPHHTIRAKKSGRSKSGRFLAGSRR